MDRCAIDGDLFDLIEEWLGVVFFCVSAAVAWLLVDGVTRLARLIFALAVAADMEFEALGLDRFERRLLAKTSKASTTTSKLGSLSSGASPVCCISNAFTLRSPDSASTGAMLWAPT